MTSVSRRLRRARRSNAEASRRSRWSRAAWRSVSSAFRWDFAFTLGTVETVAVRSRRTYSRASDEPLSVRSEVSRSGISGSFTGGVCRDSALVEAHVRSVPGRAIDYAVPA